MKRTILAAVMFLSACSDTESRTSTADAQSLACTGAAYDPCTSNDQCSSNNCHLFSQVNLQVCVTTCTPGDNSTCPVDQSGVNGQCNNMGICKPAKANDCTR